jgi:beta-lactamase regulating signal transducer with metallopeptidase domain
VAAVLTHEQAHLTGRHHPLLASSDALAAVLPFVPLFRRAPAAMRELVELAADVVSVRAHGIAAVRAALIVVSGSDVPGIALAMARDAIDVRIERLRDAVPAPGRIRRALTCATTGVLAAAAPLAIATTLLDAIGLSACLFTR